MDTNDAKYKPKKKQNSQRWNPMFQENSSDIVFIVIPLHTITKESCYKKEFEVLWIDFEPFRFN